MELLLLILLIATGPLAIMSGTSSAPTDTRDVQRWWPGVRR
jgi:hypothetical protein